MTRRLRSILTIATLSRHHRNRCLHRSNHCERDMTDQIDRNWEQFERSVFDDPEHDPGALYEERTKL